MCKYCVCFDAQAYRSEDKLFFKLQLPGKLKKVSCYFPSNFIVDKVVYNFGKLGQYCNLQAIGVKMK